MADGTVTDGTENFVIHEADGKSTAAEEGSISQNESIMDNQLEPAPEPEPEGDDDDTDIAGEPDGDGDAEGEADDGDTAADDTSDEGDGDEDDDDGDDDAADDDGEPKKRMSPKNRINKITKNWREAERRAEAAEAKNEATEARLAALEKKLTPDDDDGNDEGTSEGNTAEEGKPDPEKFPYGEMDPEYQAALMEWRLDQRDAKREAKKEETRQEEAAAAQVAEFTQSYNDKVDDGIGAYNDFEAVVEVGSKTTPQGETAKYELTQHCAMMAVKSPVGHHVVYKIAKDPVYSRKLAKMTQNQQSQEFGRLAAQFTSKGETPPKKQKKATGAMPPPSTKVNGSSAHQKSVKDMDFAEFEAHERAKAKAAQN